MQDLNKIMIFYKTEISEPYSKCIIDGDKEDHELLSYGVLFQSYRNNVIKIICHYKIKEEEEKELNKEIESEYCEEIMNAIKEHYAFAATNALVKRRYMGRYYKIANVNNTEEETGEI